MGWKTLAISDVTGLRYYSITEELKVLGEELINFLSSWSAPSLFIFFIVFIAGTMLYISLYLFMTFKKVDFA